MRAYHFLMSFWNSFRIGFCCGLIFLFCAGAVLLTLYLAGFTG